MTRLERETMVERYLACEMRADEERTFMMQVATDPELFETLRAYRYMEHSLRGDSNRLLANRLDEPSLNSYTSLPLPAATPGRVLGEKLRSLVTRSGAFTLGVTALVAGTLGYVTHMTVGRTAAPPEAPPANVQYHSSLAPEQQTSLLAAPKSDTTVAVQSTSPVQSEAAKPEAPTVEISTGAPLAATRSRTELPKETPARVRKESKSLESASTLGKTAAAQSTSFSPVIRDTSNRRSTIKMNAKVIAPNDN